jgi:hypothetical protein
VHVPDRLLEDDPPGQLEPLLDPLQLDQRGPLGFLLGLGALVDGDAHGRATTSCFRIRSFSETGKWQADAWWPLTGRSCGTSVVQIFMT